MSGRLGRWWLAALAVTAAGGAAARGAVELPAVISSHMVLQRDRAVPIWGTAAPGESVTVHFRGQQKTAQADEQGRWRVRLDPLPAGGPDRLRVVGSNTIELDDVLVGEVWVGSGQSNMDLGVAESKDPALAQAAATAHPRIRLLVSGGSWQEATPAAIAGFSALMFGFGVPLQKELDVPVGLIEAAVGASAGVCWISEAAYSTDPEIQAALRRYTEAEYPRLMAAWRAENEAAAAKAKAEGRPEPQPSRPPKEAGKFVGRWRQGVHFQFYEARVRPVLTYGIRGVLWDQGESGTGITGVAMHPFIGGLVRGWRKEWEQGDFPFLYVQKPSGPGCAWDYENPVTRLALPFAPLPEAVPDTAAGRGVEEYVRLREHPHTAMAISSDLGGGLHPANKFGYGARLARVALGSVYGRPVEYYGPVLASHAVEGAAVRVRFAHVGQGLAWKHGDRLQGFAIAGADHVFHWADARIDGDAVVVSSDRVQAPVAVRYAWGDPYPWANLFNKDGLPALPFRTDDWE